MSNHFFRTLAAGALVLGGLVAAGSASAEEKLCGNRQSIFAQLSKDFGEEPSGTGMSANGGMVELLTSANGSWTLVMSYPNGATCLIAAGDNWEVKPRAEVVADKAA